MSSIEDIYVTAPANLWERAEDLSDREIYAYYRELLKEIDRDATMMLMHKFTFALCLLAAFAVGGLVTPMLVSWFVQ